MSWLDLRNRLFTNVDPKCKARSRLPCLICSHQWLGLDSNGQNTGSLTKVISSVAVQHAHVEYLGAQEGMHIFYNECKILNEIL